ncbi:MAG: hypothetical protein EXS09_10915 [Gemmataceae bacterium]|nr:hypothetical protein [Gemmataceae bacterium]
MATPPGLIDLCDIYRPFGAGAPTYTNVVCKLVADLERGRIDGAIVWTHYLLLATSDDIRDGCTRIAEGNAITYADGDEVRMTIGSSTPRFVVAWVETVDAGTALEFKRAYLLRHTA